LNVNTSHKPLEDKLNELLAEHTAMKTQSEREACAVSRELRDESEMARALNARAPNRCDTKSSTENHFFRQLHMQVRDMLESHEAEMARLLNEYRAQGDEKQQEELARFRDITMKTHESEMARSLNEYRAQGHEKQQEELTRFRDIINLNVNTSHKPLEDKLNELLAEHTAMKTQSEREAGAVSRELRVLRQNHNALEDEIDGRFNYYVEKAVKRTVSHIETEYGVAQRQLRLDVSETRQEMAAWHQAVTSELQSVSERCESSNEEHARTLRDALKTLRIVRSSSRSVEG